MRHNGTYLKVLIRDIKRPCREGQLCPFNLLIEVGFLPFNVDGLYKLDLNPIVAADSRVLKQIKESCSVSTSPFIFEKANIGFSAFVCSKPGTSQNGKEGI